MPNWCALFDLDGTLTDPAVGIIKSYRIGLNAVGVAPLDDNVLRSHIGPPLHEAFVSLGTPVERVGDAVTAFRSHFEVKGLYENEIIEGVPDVLAQLKGDGWAMAVATSKPTVFAEKILEHFNIREYFDFVAGATLDGSRRHKADVIDLVIQSTNLDRERTIMIGDRPEDYLGADVHGIKTVAVSWGFGEVDVSDHPSVIGVATTPDQLLELLRLYSQE